MTKSEPADCCGIVHVAYSTILGNYVVLCNRQTSRQASRLKGKLLGSETERQSNLNRLPYSSTDCPTDSKTNIKAHRQLEHQTQQQTHTLIVTCSGGDLNNFQLRAEKFPEFKTRTWTFLPTLPTLPTGGYGRRLPPMSACRLRLPSVSAVLQPSLPAICAFRLCPPAPFRPPSPSARCLRSVSPPAVTVRCGVCTEFDSGGWAQSLAHYCHPSTW